MGPRPLYKASPGEGREGRAHWAAGTDLDQRTSLGPGPACETSRETRASAPMAILPEACGPWGPPSPRQRVSGPTALWVSPRSPVPERRPGMGVRCGRGLPHAPSCWALWQPLLWGPVSAPGTGGARRSFPGCPQLPEAEAEGWPGPAAGQTPQLSCPGPGLGLGPGRNPEGPKLLPTCVPQVGVGWRGAEKLQNSLELRKTGPSCGAPLACLSAWVLGRGARGG